MAGGRAGLNPRRGIEHDAAGLTGDAGPDGFMNATANETLVFKRAAAGAPDRLGFQLPDTDSDRLLFAG